MNNYWVDRFAKEEDFINNLSLKQIDIAKKEYDRAYREVNRTISTWYSKYAKNNNLSITEASKLLNSRELKEHRMSLEEYIEKGRSLDIARDDKIVKQLELASARVHLDRLESLRHEIKAEIDLMTKKVETSIKEHLTKVIDDGYFKSAYHLRGVADIERLNSNLIEKIIYKPWTSDNKNWSKRLWGHDNRLVNVLHQGLIQNMVSGKSLNKIIETVAERFNAETSIAARLILTESAAYHSLAKVECFKDLDVEKYEIVATLDSRTSPKCQSMDGKIIDMKLYQVGVTAPPFHCRCRSTTAPYYEAVEGDVNTRAARTLKEEHELVDDVSYPEWRKGLINPETSIVNKKKSGIIEVEKPIPKPKTLNNFESHSKKWEEDVVKKVLTQEEIDVVGKGMRNLIDKNEYSMRVKSSDIEKILKDNRFKTQFETKTSGGSVSSKWRKQATEKMFGSNSKKLRKIDYEKYGYLGDKDFLLDVPSSASQYGDIIIRFDKQKLKNKVTYTLGDSLGPACTDKLIAGDVIHPNANGIPKQKLKEVYNSMKSNKFNSIKEFLDDAYIDRYVELQYHGDLNIDDIKEICFTENLPDKNIIEQLKNKNIKLYKAKYHMDDYIGGYAYDEIIPIE